MIRVLLVDDQHLVRAGLRMLCESAADIEVVGEADSGASAVRAVDTTAPDVILMDLHMPGIDGVSATRTITASRPSTRILVLTTFDDDDHLYPSLEAGVRGFLAKSAAPDLLLESIRRAADGDSPFRPPSSPPRRNCCRHRASCGRPCVRTGFAGRTDSA
jgi:DNA-binding NarL/FixJ family response regulator